MRRLPFYILVVLLYILTPICILNALGIMISKKYEVDESYWEITWKSDLTPAQKKQQTDILDSKGKQMDRKATTFTLIAFAISITATGLLIKRNKIIRDQKFALNKL